MDEGKPGRPKLGYRTVAANTSIVLSYWSPVSTQDGATNPLRPQEVSLTCYKQPTCYICSSR